MLLNFKVKNFKSFRNETIFTMIPSLQRAHNDYIIRKAVSGHNLRALPVAVIYGANASGKSNIILAMYLLKKFVMAGSLDDKELSAYIGVLSFIQDHSWYEPIEFEIEFSTDENIYKYGLSLTNIDHYDIVEEFLHINGTEIYARSADNHIRISIDSLIKKGFINPDDEEFGEILMKKIGQTLDGRHLILVSAISNLISHDYFREIKEWFSQLDIIMNPADISLDQKNLKFFGRNSQEKEEMENLEVSEVKFMESDTIREIMKMAEFGNQKIGFVSDKDKDELSMRSMYKVPAREESGSEFSYSMVVNSELMESKGTIQFIRLVQPFVDILKKGGVIVLDEMDASLHFELVVSLIRIFNNKDLNKKGAQLIFNTHNPIYLDGELFRHDQIIMMEKNKKTLSSELYSLSDYGLRPEERILKNYLDGKYGALPHMDLEISFKRILEKEMAKGE